MLFLISPPVSFEVHDNLNERNRCVSWYYDQLTSNWKWTGGGWWPAAGGTWFAEEIIAVHLPVCVCVCMCRVSDWSWQWPLYCWLACRFSRPVLDTLIWIKCSSVSVGTRSGASTTPCPFTCFLHPQAHLEQAHPPPHTPRPSALLQAFSFPSTSAQRTLYSGPPTGARTFASALGGKGSRTGIKPAQSSSPLPHLLQLVAASTSVTLDMLIISNSAIFIYI